LRSGADRLPLVLGAVYLALALHGLGAADIVGDDEAREAGIVQDVLAGHVLWPRFNGELIPDKPILYHWLAALASTAGGFSETAVRLPSALAAAALVAWTARAGAAFVGTPAGVVAGGLLATMPALASRARVARPDALLVLLLSVALGFAYRWWRDDRRGDATRALAAVGAAMLAKGPVAPVLFALTVGAFLAWQGDLRRLRGLATVPGVIALAILGLGWYALALAGWGDAFVHQHLVGRYAYNLIGDLPAGGQYSRRPLAYHLAFYLEHLPAVALPWTPCVALALWQAWRRDRLRDPAVRFLLCWSLAPVVAFTPAQWKLRHYLLPALPALALLAAPAVVALARGRPRPLAPRDGGLALAAALAAGAGVGALAAGLVPLSPSDRGTVDAAFRAFPGGAFAATTTAALAAGALCGAAARAAWRPVLAAVAAGGVLWMAFGVPRLEAETSRRDSLRPFAEAVGRLVPPDGALAFYGSEPMRSVVVYLGRRVPTVRRPEEITAGLAVIARAEDHTRLAAAGRLGPPRLVAEGRPGNVARETVVLAEGR
jgi:4-amino-4-deoxy-L-arabinose transferase-like glycosyltransferase